MGLPHPRRPDFNRSVLPGTGGLPVFVGEFFMTVSAVCLWRYSLKLFPLFRQRCLSCHSFRPSPGPESRIMKGPPKSTFGVRRSSPLRALWCSPCSSLPLYGMSRKRLLTSFRGRRPSVSFTSSACGVFISLLCRFSFWRLVPQRTLLARAVS